ncbi:MAG: hypothetical protein JO256_05300 [Alphaproteobacteria bacterium]|nr:hypothetical protein [Alphaproteobacteria bacterium]
MRFLEYIAARRASFTAQGDFIRFALSDVNFPDANSWAEINEYLKRSPDPRVRLLRVAAEVVWANYKDRAESAGG